LSPQKICYFDLETSGLDAQKNGVVQIAMLVEIDRKVVGERNWFVQPYRSDQIAAEALAINHLTVEQVKSFPLAQIVLSEVKTFLSQYVNRYNGLDKFTPAGYNVQFDLNFLKQFFLKGGDQFFGSWFNYRTVDPMLCLYWLRYAGLIDLPNYKLETVCAHFDIGFEGEAHEALADVKATRDLIKLLTTKYLYDWKGENRKDGEQRKSEQQGSSDQADGQPEGSAGESEASTRSGSPASPDA